MLVERLKQAYQIPRDCRFYEGPPYCVAGALNDRGKRLSCATKFGEYDLRNDRTSSGEKKFLYMYNNLMTIYSYYIRKNRGSKEATAEAG